MDARLMDSSDLSEAEEAELEIIKKCQKEFLEDIQKIKEEIAEIFLEIDLFQQEQSCKIIQRDKNLCIGRKKFNMDPVKGIQYLVEHKVLSLDAQEIAKFLYQGEGLNKTAIGDYLGQRDPLNLQILQAFVECHQFANLNLVQALRQFLWSFRLPGEAQKIDRMMEAFANWYCQCNSGIFQSTDACYILSFSVIMLNTSLHNPNVKDKPPFERFVSMNRGINNGEDLQEAVLKNLFDSIKNEPFSIPEDDGNDLTHTFFNPSREGWLLKLGGRVKTWKRRWFILTDNCLYYFEYTTDKEPLGIIPLENLSIQPVDDLKKPVGKPSQSEGKTASQDISPKAYTNSKSKIKIRKQEQNLMFHPGLQNTHVPWFASPANCFELFNANCKGQKIKACKTDGDGKVVEGKHQSYKISAASQEDRDLWIEAIRTSITRDPFYDLVAARKKKVASKK